MRKKQFNKFTYVGYGMADLFGSGCFAVIATWYLIFLTSYTDLSATQAASIFAITRVIDGALNPIMGMITDKFGNTKLGRMFGRRRFFLLLAIPLLPIYAALWVTDMPYLYYLLMFISIEAVATMVLIPWETLPAEMTTDFNRRSYMANWRFIWAGMAYTLASFIPSQLFRHFGDDNPDVFFYNAVIFTGMAMVAMLVTYLFTWERSDIDQTYNVEEMSKIAKEEKQSLTWALVKALVVESLSTLKIRAFRQHLTIYISSFTALDLFGGILVFWVVYALGLNKAVVADSMALGGLISMPLGFFSAWFLIQLGPRNMFTICYGVVLGAIVLISSLYFFSLDKDMLTNAIFVLMVIFVVFKGPLYFLPWNLYAFIPDVDELVTKQRREGSFAAFMTLIRKLTLAISMLFLGILLDLGGLDKEADVQPDSAIHMMEGILFIGVVGGLVIALIVVFRFNLNKETHQVLVAEVHRLKTGGDKADVDDETREIVEDLTGFKYDQLWGNNNVCPQPDDNDSSNGTTSNKVPTKPKPSEPS